MTTYMDKQELSDFIVARRTGGLPIAEAVQLGDGTSISVQASSFHYCSPRDDTPPPGGYNSYEVWNYPDQGEDPTQWTWDEVSLYIHSGKGAL